MFIMRSLVGAGVCAVVLMSSVLAQSPPDPYVWLESMDSPQVTQWVHAENEKTLAVLERDANYAGFYRDALSIAESADRIPTPSILGGAIYNFWQDAEHVRGIWRRTTVPDYASPMTRWTTVLDLDQLARNENANWVFEGEDCAEPAQRRCMLQLSDGGEDAITAREFDLRAMQFVAGGFSLPHGKQRLAWEDENTLLVAREFAAGELTKSGYPYIVKRLKRGEALTQAREIFRGSADDGGYGVQPQALEDGAGHRAVVLLRPVSTFEYEYYLVTGNTVARLGLPAKAQVEGLIDGRLIVSVKQDWAPDGIAVPAGAIAALELTAVRRHPAHLHPFVVYAPGPREAVESVAVTRDELLVNALENVRGRLFAYHPLSQDRWTRQALPLPENSTISIVDADVHSDRAYAMVSGFLQPSTLFAIDTKGATAERVKMLEPKFDSSRDMVEQYEAASSDGVKIPYFIVRRADMAFDGANPTVLTAYGGFDVSNTPRYQAIVGKLWLERGGVYVLANIRGGGEFGPAWHEAGLKTHRQIIYDDFAAVARDLIARRVTSPAHLGIQGGSNGGLLMGVEMTQHPELWNAVDIQVPLLDMLRFEQIAAGTSWVGEYGSVSNPFSHRSPPTRSSSAALRIRSPSSGPRRRTIE
jgi:prolyl oligopeptidase